MELLELLITLPALAMDLGQAVWKFIQQPPELKAKQVAKGGIFAVLAVVLSPCACCISLLN